MKLYKKIDLYYNGDYVCSTQQSKTCKQARQKYLDSVDDRSHSLGGIGLVDKHIKNNPHLLKALFECK